MGFLNPRPPLKKKTNHPFESLLNPQILAADITKHQHYLSPNKTATHLALYGGPQNGEPLAFLHSPPPRKGWGHFSVLSLPPFSFPGASSSLLAEFHVPQPQARFPISLGRQIPGILQPRPPPPTPPRRGGVGGVGWDTFFLLSAPSAGDSPVSPRCLSQWDKSPRSPLLEDSCLSSGSRHPAPTFLGSSHL